MAEETVVRKFAEVGTYTKIRCKNSTAGVSKIVKKGIYYATCCMTFRHTQIYSVTMYFNIDKLHVFFIGKYCKLALQAARKWNYACDF